MLLDGGDILKDEGNARFVNGALTTILYCTCSSKHLALSLLAENRIKVPCLIVLKLTESYVYLSDEI